MTSTDLPRLDAHDTQGRRLTMFVLPEPHCVRPVRHAVKAILIHWEMAHLTDDAELLTTELLTNAIKHTDSEQPIRVTIALEQRWLAIGIRDRSASAPQAHRATACQEGGRGLLLVESIAGAWAYRLHLDGTKTVSCRLPL
ncbi:MULTISPECIES: ATP-binding protein [Kitasatospora]|uniref:ATP-binding protein n=1 Tax=Kitasatospora cathayae TaxID=3004092 RepID=A0ABY7QGY4_9ACTN|nr:ATP-binding protein [Kitasatospora sp. HUAS 3-15]WBP92071.1 ATP-binding protein [Kitasatospora sp. HUAS 3-15]